MDAAFLAFLDDTLVISCGDGGTGLYVVIEGMSFIREDEYRLHGPGMGVKNTYYIHTLPIHTLMESPLEN